LFALKPAPIQVSWLGYWGTTGLSAMDYLLTDALTVPPQEDRWYAERIVRLPGIRFCYSPPDYAPAPKEEPPALRNGWVTFGSFNNLAKLGPGVIGLWADILRTVPNARLLLKWGSLDDGAVRQRLTEAFDREDIATDRLILRGGSPHTEMLAEYGDIDIALDPFPFSGGLTSCEALWMGVPVVTLPGDRAISRQTAGFLTVLGLSNLAATTPAAYVIAAKNLAADIGRLKELRLGLRPHMAHSALCDGASYTRNVETAFRTMWETWCADQGHEK
jgi:predicted O-linked N-acetylglucosamine transferase (SPINDLY family)